MSTTLTPPREQQATSTTSGTSRTVRWSAATLAVVVGAIHLVLSPEYLEKQTYIGVLFIVGGAALVAAAIGIVARDDRTSWVVGALVMAGMFVGFILSRTTGLPSFHEEEWELSGIVSLVLEAGFLALLPLQLRPRR